MKWKNRSALVTGGAGLVGSRIALQLAALGARVRILDNQSAYPFDQKGHFGLDGLESLEYVRGDIGRSPAVARALKGVDIVFHEAAFADVAASIWNPEADFEANVLGTQNILECSRKADIQRVIFASSASVYGDPVREDGKVPKFAEDQRTGPLSTYANSKLWGENQMLLFHRLYGLNTTSLRYFSIYGSPQVPKKKSHSWAVAIFAMRLLKRKPLGLNGGGSQVRDFIHVNDIAKANIRAAEKDGTIGQIINVGTGTPTTVRTLAGMIEEVSGIKARLVVTLRPKGDPLGGYADTKLMARLLDWTPGIGLRKGVEEYWSWVLKNPKVIPDWL